MKATLKLVGREIMNFAKLVDPEDQGNIRVVQTSSGSEIRWVKIDGL